MIDFEEYRELPDDLSSIFTEDAIDIIKRFPPVEIGNRPRDWMKRDLLLGAALSHRENWMFRKLLKDRPLVLFGDIPEEITQHRQIVEQGIAFDFLHRFHLFGIREGLGETDGSRPEFFRLLQCPTSLWLTKTEKKRTVRDCGYAWLCPHCYARNMADCVKFLESSCSTANCCFLALMEAYLEIDDEDIPQSRSRINVLRSSMIALARRYGASGGVWTTQISPEESIEQNWDYDDLVVYNPGVCQKIRVAVLAAIPPAMDSISAIEPLLTGNVRLERELECDADRLMVDVLPFRGTSTIRAVAIQAYPSSTPRVWFKNCRFGLFFWPPIWSLNCFQWQLRARLLKGLKTYSRWGTLRRRGCSYIPCVAPESDPEAATAFRREELLRAATMLLVSVSSPNEKSLGHRKLRQCLSEHGHVVSERDARWLAKELKVK